jgi:hypothetical protein
MLNRDILNANSYERDLIARAHKLARIATNALNFLESQDLLGVMIESIPDPIQRQELEKWWDNHKKVVERDSEKKQKAEERARKVQKALAKLTPAERRLLRIKIKNESGTA